MSDSDYKRAILVTGSNTGIGYALVRLLAAKGHIVYLSARNEVAGKAAVDKLKEEDGLTVKFVHLDVTIPASIVSAAKTIEESEGKLDVLVNNAALCPMDIPLHASDIPIDVLRTTFDVNFFGVVNTTQVFLPLLLKAKKGYGVILQVTTALASNGYLTSTTCNDFVRQAVPYNAPKCAANSYIISLAYELRGQIKVNAASPGFSSTNLNNFLPGGQTAEQGAAKLVKWALLGPEDNDKTCLFSVPDGDFQW